MVRKEKPGDSLRMLSSMLRLRCVPHASHCGTQLARTSPLNRCIFPAAGLPGLRYRTHVRAVRFSVRPSTNIKKAWRCPTLPRVSSTIGAGGLNFRVRNGNGWGPSAIVTRLLIAFLCQVDHRTRISNDVNSHLPLNSFGKRSE